MSTFAPAARSARIASVRRFAAANISALSPRVGSTALTSAPWATSDLTASAWPEALANISGVTPLADVPFASAPAASSASIAPALPLSLAIRSGV